MYQGQSAVALGQALEGMLLADLGAHVLGDARLALDQVALAVKARGVHGIADAHLEIEDVQDHLHDL